MRENTPTIKRVTITIGRSEISVDTFWTGVDRPHGQGFTLGIRDTALAIRLKRAILAGVVFTDPVIARDVNGKTFAHYRCHVIGRHMNADLKRVGF